MKPKPPLYINAWFVVTCVLAFVLIALMLMAVFGDVEGQTERETCAITTDRYIQIGRQPYDFTWLEALPYAVARPMAWDATAGFTELTTRPALLYTVVDRETGIVYELYAMDEAYFVWGFTERRGADGHPHPTDAAHWVVWDE